MKWVVDLRKSLEKQVGETLTRSMLPQGRWDEIQVRKQELHRWEAALNELRKQMQPEDQQGFGLLVDREVMRPFQRLRDMVLLRQITGEPDNPVLLLKGALLGEELMDEAAIEGLLRRTRPGQMVRYFLSELNRRLAHRAQNGMEDVYQALSPLCGSEVEIIIARPGDAFDVKRHHIAGQDTTGAQPRDRIVRCVALGLRDVTAGIVEPKARVIISS